MSWASEKGWGPESRSGAFPSGGCCCPLGRGSIEPTWWQQVLGVSPCVRAEGGGERAVWWNFGWFLGLGPSNQVSVTFSMTGNWVIKVWLLSS